MPPPHFVTGDGSVAAHLVLLADDEIHIDWLAGSLLPAERFGESDVRTAVTLLANHGLARLLKFGDLVLLRPDLLNGYAGAIIRAARAHTDEIGCVLEADIYQPDFDITGVERLTHRPDEELLLRALVQTFLDHSFCIAEETPQGREKGLRPANGL